MTADNITVMKPVDHYERLVALADLAGMKVSEISREAGVTGMTLYMQKRSEGLRWKTSTINSVSTVLAPRLGMRPSEVSAILSGLEDMPDLPRSA